MPPTPEHWNYVVGLRTNSICLLSCGVYTRSRCIGWSIEESLALAHQCLEIATELGDPGLLLEAHHAAWGSYYFHGDYDKAFEHMQAGLVIYDRTQHEPLSVHYGVHDAGACALYESALALWNMGFLDKAHEHQARAVALAKELTLPANIADAYSYAGLFYQLLREPQQTQQYAQLALQISNEKGYPYTRILSAVLLGWSLAMQGQMAEGIALARQGLDAANETSLRLHYSQLAAMLAEILMAAGRHEEAIEVLERGHPPLRAVSRPAVRRGLVDAQRGRSARFEHGLRRGRGVLPERAGLGAPAGRPGVGAARSYSTCAIVAQS